jgi:hypothetical protein
MYKPNLKEPYFYGNQKAYQFSYCYIECRQNIKNPVMLLQIFTQRLQSAPIIGVTCFQRIPCIRYREIVELVEVMDAIQKRLTSYVSSVAKEHDYKFLSSFHDLLNLTFHISL